MTCVPSINGDKHPQIGQMARVKQTNPHTPNTTMLGKTLGQYTAHAEEPFKPFEYGKYTNKYARRTMFVPMHARVAYVSDLMARGSVPKRILSSRVMRATTIATTSHANATSLSQSRSDKGLVVEFGGVVDVDIAGPAETDRR